MQHGFIKELFTVSNLLCVKYETASALSSREPYDVIAFDFSRSFDRVLHHLLLEELAGRSITGPAFRRL